MNCEFCNNKFSSLSALNTHKKTAKYCLEIQNKNIDHAFICNYCNKNFTSKQMMNKHKTKCKDFYISFDLLKTENILLKQRLEDKEQQLKEKDDQIKDLQNKLASKPTHIQNNNQRINNIINNLLPITDDHLKEQAQFLTLEHIKNGPSGYAKYALDYPLKDRITCPDFARRKISYKDSEGNLVSDPDMKKLCEKLFKSIDEQNSILTDQYIQELYDRLSDLNRNTSNNMNEEESDIFGKQSDEIIDFLIKYKKQKTEIKKVAKGESSEIIHEFVKDVCAKVTP